MVNAVTIVINICERLTVVEFLAIMFFIFSLVLLIFINPAFAATRNKPLLFYYFNIFCASTKLGIRQLLNAYVVHLTIILFASAIYVSVETILLIYLNNPISNIHAADVARQVCQSPEHQAAAAAAAYTIM